MLSACTSTVVHQILPKFKAPCAPVVSGWHCLTLPKVQHITHGPALQVVVILMVLAILLVSAAAVTKLMAINISASRNIVWSQADMTNRIDTAMLVSACWLCPSWCTSRVLRLSVAHNQLYAYMQLLRVHKSMHGMLERQPYQHWQQSPQRHLLVCMLCFCHAESTAQRHPDTHGTQRC